jgi:hypothetical protein
MCQAHHDSLPTFYTGTYGSCSKVEALHVVVYITSYSSHTFSGCLLKHPYVVGTITSQILPKLVIFAWALYHLLS